MLRRLYVRAPRRSCCRRRLLLLPLPLPLPLVRGCRRAFHSIGRPRPRPMPFRAATNSVYRAFSSYPEFVEVTMPALSPTMEEGGIARWLKKEGDYVDSGDVIAQVETDKATVDFECVDEGYLAKVLVPEGTTGVKVGSLVAVIVDNESDMAAFKDFSGGDQPADGSAAAAAVATPEAEPTAESQPQTPPSDLPAFTEIPMPALSPTMETGQIACWLKKEGDEVSAGDVLAQVETDKATVDFESLEDGYLARILVSPGSGPLEVGKTVAIFVEDEADVAAFKNFDPTQSASKATEGSKSTPETPKSMPSSSKAPQPESRAAGEPVRASPYARKLARDKGIELASVPGTGPNGRIIAADVNEFKVSAANAVVAGDSTGIGALAGLSEYEEIPVTTMRKVIAKRLLESKQTIPHYYLTSKISADEILSVRKQLNARLGENGGKISMNDFIIKAAAAALRTVPTVNSSWAGDTIRQFKYVDINVAVSTKAGLVTPFVVDADMKGLRQISMDVKRLAEKARDGKLTPAEFQGGTFTISNLGMMGVDQFCAIVNPPQAAILAVGTTSNVLRPCSSSPAGFRTSTEFSVTLSCDHRVVDGAVGAEWLKVFKQHCEDPMSLLL